MAMTLIQSQTASGDDSLDFTSGIDSTYKLYIFKMVDINPETDGVRWGFQANASSQSGYNETITSTSFYSSANEGDSSTGVSYVTGNDQAQGTAVQRLFEYMGGGADESGAGTLWLFNPSNTTYVKHFYATTNNYSANDYSLNNFVGGYFNVTAAITNIQFKAESDAFDGTIKLYGVG